MGASSILVITTPSALKRVENKTTLDLSSSLNLICADINKVNGAIRMDLIKVLLPVGGGFNFFHVSI
jgi:hypothetical protein